MKPGPACINHGTTGKEGASFHRQVQELAESLPSHRLAPASQTRKIAVSEKTLPQHFALEGETRHKFLPEHPPQLEHMMLKIEILQKVVRKFARGRLPPTLVAELAADDCKQDSDNNNNNSNNNNNNNHNNNTTNNNNNNDDNNDNSNNKNSQKSDLNSLDLDNDNPESESDPDAENLGSFSPTLGVESSLRSLDQHEANLSFNSLGQQTMAIGISLGSLIQQQQDSQEGMQIGTAWEPSLETKKTVSFDEANLAYNKRQQNNGQKQAKGSHPRSFQLEQLGGNTEKQKLPEQNNKDQLPKLAGIAFSKRMKSSNRLHQLWRRSFSIRHAQATA